MGATGLRLYPHAPPFLLPLPCPSALQPVTADNRDRQESIPVTYCHFLSHARGIGARILLIYIDPVLTKQDS